MRPDPWQAALDDRGLATPFLAVEHDVLEANVGGMAARIAELGGVGVPHLKTHKSTEISRLQQAAGARAATVATVAEAELAVSCGFERVFVAYPPVPESRLDALVGLAERAEVEVTCTSREQVAALSRTGAPFGVYWEIDSGTGRLGTAPGTATARELLHADFGVGGTRFRGLMTFAGAAYGTADDAALAAVRRAQDQALAETVEAIGGTLPPSGLSVGVTPLARFESGIATEYRYGNYVFNDASQISLGGVTADDCALAVITTVVDAPSPTRLIIDAGSKSLPAELMTPRVRGYGVVVGHPTLTLSKLYEEHGLCESREPHRLGPGDRLAVIPNHACTCANSHDWYVVYAGGARRDWWPVRSRRAFRPA